MVTEYYNTDLARRVCLIKCAQKAESLSQRYEQARKAHKRSIGLLHRLQATQHRLLYLEGGGNPFPSNGGWGGD